MALLVWSSSKQAAKATPRETRTTIAFSSSAARRSSHHHHHVGFRCVVSFHPRTTRKRWWMVLTTTAMTWKKMMMMMMTTSRLDSFIVTAKCIVQDHKGIPLSLGNLPTGVQYDLGLDELTCKQERICAQWSIAHCAVVKCVGRYACQAAELLDNQSVSCYDYGACQQATFPRSHSVFCGMDHLLSCQGAILEVDRTLMCLGRHACVQSSEDTQMIVRVQAHSTVRCAHSGGRGAYSCQHLHLLVPHAKHACFSTLNTQADLPCAVVCDEDDECNKDTIFFEVEPL